MDIQLIETFDDSEVLRKLEALDKRLQSIETNAAALGGAVNGSLKEVAEVADAANKALGEQGNAAAAAAAQNGRLTEAKKGLIAQFKETITQSGLYQRATGAANAASGAFQKVLGGLRGGVGGVGTALRGLWAIIAANPIGIAIAAVVLMLSYFVKLKDIVKVVERVFYAVTPVIEKVIGAFQSLGGSIFYTVDAAVKFITLDWDGAGKSMEQAGRLGKEAFKGITSDLSDSAQAAYRLKAAMQELNSEMEDLRVNRALQEAALSKLRLIQDDETKGYKERIRAAQEAAVVEQDILNKRVEFAERNRRLIIAGNRNGTETDEARNDAQIAYIEATKERYEIQYRNEQTIKELQREQIEKISAARKKQAAEDAKAAKDALEAQAKLNALVEAYNELRFKTQNRATVSFTNENTTQKAVAELSVNLRVLEKEIKEAQDAALKAGLKYDLSGQFAQIRESILFAANKELFEKLAKEFAKRKAEALAKGLQFNDAAEVQKLFEDFKKEVEKLPGVDAEAFTRLFLGNKGEIDKAAMEAIRRILEAMKASGGAVTEEDLNVFEKLKKQLLKKLGITEAEAKEIFSALQDAISTSLEGYDDLLSARVEFQDALIEKIEESIDKQEAALEKELELARLGQANSVDAERTKLALLQAEREAAEAKKAEYERKAANAQLIVDSAVQASNIATAVTKLIASEASKGVIGVVASLGAIALLFRIFTQAKANSIRASAQKLREGKRISGKPHEQGGEEYEGVDGRRYEVEHAEWVIGTKHSREHNGFLERLNAGGYAGRDLLRELAGQPTSGQRIHHEAHRAADTERATRHAEASAADFAMTRSLKAVTEAVVGAIKKRPHYAPKEHVKITSHDGGTTKTVRKTE